MSQRVIDGRRLGRQIGGGGEGNVFEIDGDAKRVAKVFHQPRRGRQAEKLEAILRFRPAADLAEVAAWPDALLRGPGGVVLGLTMSKVSGCQPLYRLSGPKNRLQHFPTATWHFLVAAARNVAATVEEAHAAGLVVGDLNESGLLVGADATVRMIDCESCQIRDTNGVVYRCDVGKAEYTPPELCGVAFGTKDRAASHDNFGLAVLVFQLLFVGRHPFAGVSPQGEEAPPLAANIAAGRYVFARSGCRDLAIPRHVPRPATFVSDTLAAMFERAFARGPNRPLATDWRKALETLNAAVITCGRNAIHAYPRSAGACPWCEIETSGGPFFFNGAGAAKQGVKASPLDFDAGFDPTALWNHLTGLTLPPQELAAVAPQCQAAPLPAEADYPALGPAPPRPEEPLAPDLVDVPPYPLDYASLAPEDDKPPDLELLPTEESVRRRFVRRSPRNAPVLELEPAPLELPVPPAKMRKAELPAHAKTGEVLEPLWYAIATQRTLMTGSIFFAALSLGGLLAALRWPTALLITVLSGLPTIIFSVVWLIGAVSNYRTTQRNRNVLQTWLNRARTRRLAILRDNELRRRTWEIECEVAQKAHADRMNAWRAECQAVVIHNAETEQKEREALQELEASRRQAEILNARRLRLWHEERAMREADRRHRWAVELAKVEAKRESAMARNLRRREVYKARLEAYQRSADLWDAHYGKHRSVLLRHQQLVAGWEREAREADLTKRNLRLYWRDERARVEHTLDGIRQQFLTFRGNYNHRRQLYQQEVDLRHTGGRSTQLEAYLDSHLIRDATIAQFGSARKATLAAYGLETALDLVNLGNKVSLAGMGPALVLRLHTWRDNLVRKFVYHSSQPVDAATLQRVYAQHRPERDGLRQEMQRVLERAIGIVGSSRQQYASLNRQLQTVLNCHAQAAANLAAARR